ncbi:MAG: hypothetical protein JRI68_09235 [Deltaproteobacteria bacterium]|nr:hypothetical protein [Deltaproteobacteria bacterium]
MAKKSEEKPEDKDDDLSPEDEEATDEDSSDGEDEGDEDDDDDDDDDDDGDEDDADDDEDDGEDEDDDDDEEDEEPEPSPEPKKAVAKKASKSAAKRPSAKKKTSARKRSAKGRGRPAQRKKGSPTRNIIFFVLVVGGIAAAFAFLGNQSGGGGAPKAKWKTGETVDVELTLVHTDRQNLACAMKDEIKGRHCGFEAQNKRSSKSNDPTKNDKLLQPYTTTGGQQLMASGLWMQPSMIKGLPKSRFSVKCKFVVEGKSKAGFVRWKPGEGWHPGNGWYTGELKDCSLAKAQK